MPKKFKWGGKREKKLIYKSQTAINLSTVFL